MPHDVRIRVTCGGIAGLCARNLHVRDGETDINAPLSDVVEQVHDEHLLRHDARLRRMVGPRQILLELTAFAIQPELDPTVIGRPGQQVGQPPLLEHAGIAVLADPAR